MNKADASELRELLEHELDNDPRLVGTALASHAGGWCVRVFVDDSRHIPLSLWRLESTRPEDVEIVRGVSPQLD